MHNLLKNSLRERAQSERLQILGERLRRVRGPKVRRSLIPAIPSHIPPPSTLPYHPFNSTSVHINFFSAQRTIHNSCSSSRRRRPAAPQGTLSTSIAAEPTVEEPQELLFNASSVFSPFPAWPAYSPSLRGGTFGCKIGTISSFTDPALEEPRKEQTGTTLSTGVTLTTLAE